MSNNIETPQPQEPQPRLIASVLPDGNIDLNITGLAPWAVIGICETIKQQMHNMTGGQQVGGLVRAPAGTLDHLGKGGKPS